jgi:hypothetical protein
MCSPVGLRIADAVCPNEGPLFVYRIVGKPGERAPAGERVLTRRVVWLVRGMAALLDLRSLGGLVTKC